jgi:hypothetical protein
MKPKCLGPWISCSCSTCKAVRAAHREHAAARRLELAYHARVQGAKP